MKTIDPLLRLDVAPIGVVHVQDRAAVVDQNIDSAQGRDGIAGNLIRLRVMRQIAARRHRSDVLRLDLTSGRDSPCPIAPVDDDMATLRRQFERDGSAETGTAPTDERALAF